MTINGEDESLSLRERVMSGTGFSWKEEPSVNQWCRYMAAMKMVPAEDPKHTCAIEGRMGQLYALTLRLTIDLQTSL